MMKILFPFIIFISLQSIPAYNLKCPMWSCSTQLSQDICIQENAAENIVSVNQIINKKTESCFISNLQPAEVDSQVNWEQIKLNVPQQPEKTQPDESDPVEPDKQTSGKTTVAKEEASEVNKVQAGATINVQGVEQNVQHFKTIKKQESIKAEDKILENVIDRICKNDEDYWYDKLKCDLFLRNVKLYQTYDLDDLLLEHNITKPDDREDDWGSCWRDDQCESNKCLCVPRTNKHSNKHKGRCMTSVFEGIYEDFFEYTCFAKEKDKAYKTNQCYFRIIIEYGHIIKQLEKNEEKDRLGCLVQFNDAVLFNKDNLKIKTDLEDDIKKYYNKHLNIKEEEGLSTVAIIFIILGGVIILLLLILLCCCCICTTSFLAKWRKQKNEENTDKQIEEDKQYQSVPNT